MTSPNRHLDLHRHFTIEGEDPYLTVEWEWRTSELRDDRTGELLHRSRVEVPKHWSQAASDILASKYLRKAGVPQKDEDGNPILDEDGNPVLGSETSMRQVAHRLAGTWADWAERAGYVNSKGAKVLYDEAVYCLLHQIFAPNSPQWFNTGLWWAYGIDSEGSPRWYVDPDTEKLVETTSRYRRPEPNACFITPIYDNLTAEGGIGEFLLREMRIFQAGAGSGANYSAIRAAGERLSGGGVSSGLMSFLRVFDRSAGAIKSGGTTRRAARMVIVDADHPEIEDFIDWKVNEEKKVAALVAAGYDSDWRGEAYETVSGQNANNSVGVTHAFIQAVIDDADWHLTARTDGSVMKTVKARDLWRRIAVAAHASADPGVIFLDHVNAWNAVPHVGPIRASNPCVTADTWIHTSEGPRQVKDLVGTPFEAIVDGKPYASDGFFFTGHKDVIRLTSKDGHTLTLTPDHQVLTPDRGWVAAGELGPGDEVVLHDHFGVLIWDGPGTEDEGYLLGRLVGDGHIDKAGNTYLRVWTTDPGYEGPKRHLERTCANLPQHHSYKGSGPTGDGTQLRLRSMAVRDLAERFGIVHNHKTVTPEVESASSDFYKGFLRGLFDTDGHVEGVSTGSGVSIRLGSTDRAMLQAVQRMLARLGIKSVIRKLRDGGPKAMPGGIYECKPSWRLIISSEHTRRFMEEVGFADEKKAASWQKATEDMEKGFYSKSFTTVVESVEPAGTADVYDATVETVHAFDANGFYVHNCSEFFQPDTAFGKPSGVACNLASVKLTAFLSRNPKTGELTFDYEGFSAACYLLAVILETTVFMSQYPDGPTAVGSYNLRNIGIGVTDLGALLMSAGIPYDSDAGRAVAAALVGAMTAAAYTASADLAEVAGPYGWWDRENHRRVVRNHAAAYMGAQDLKLEYDGLDPAPPKLDPEALPGWAAGAYRHGCALWSEVLDAADRGFRNAFISLTAPTGTISFVLDADTTGIEPAFALKSYKKLAGGGMMELAARSVSEGLISLGYEEPIRAAILAHVTETGRISDAPGLHSEHVKVFETAVGDQPISPEGHVRMLAALQPMLSGASSKTINLPTTATPEDIESIHMMAWQLGVKAVAVYRDGSKLSQVLSTTDDTGAASVRSDVETLLAHLADSPRGVSPSQFWKNLGLDGPPRFDLAERRHGWTQEVTVGGSKMFVRTGEYEDGTLGEIFLDLAKEGSTLRGVLAALAMSMSLGLQSGVPLEKYVKLLGGQTFEPRGIVQGDPHVKMASSPVDYIVRTLAIHYLGRHDLANVPPDGSEQRQAHTTSTPPTAAASDSSPQPSPSDICPNCHNATLVVTGTCKACQACGESVGGC